jgi:hypothetical protein
MQVHIASRFPELVALPCKQFGRICLLQVEETKQLDDRCEDRCAPETPTPSRIFSNEAASNRPNSRSEEWRE